MSCVIFLQTIHAKLNRLLKRQLLDKSVEKADTLRCKTYTIRFLWRL